MQLEHQGHLRVLTSGPAGLVWIVEYIVMAATPGIMAQHLRQYASFTILYRRAATSFDRASGEIAATYTFKTQRGHFVSAIIFKS